VTLPSFMGVFVTTDGAPAITYSRLRGFKARFSLDTDGQQCMCRYERDAPGIIHNPGLRLTRLSQGIHGGKVHKIVPPGTTFRAVDMEHTTEQPWRTDAECLVAMLHSDNQDKAGDFTTFSVYNPVFKPQHDQRGARFPDVDAGRHQKSQDLGRRR
jgi:hypothetical protein